MRLTANVYTDPKLLDIGGALEALPALPLDSDPSNAQEQARALKTGTCDSLPLAPTLALTNEQAGQNGGSPDNTNPFGLLRIHEAALAVNAYSVNEKRTLTSSVSVLQKSGRLDTVRTFSGWRPGLGSRITAAVGRWLIEFSSRNRPENSPGCLKSIHHLSTVGPVFQEATAICGDRLSPWNSCLDERSLPKPPGKKRPDEMKLARHLSLRRARMTQVLRRLYGSQRNTQAPQS